MFSSWDGGGCSSALLATSAGKSVFDNAREGAGEVAVETEHVDI